MADMVTPGCESVRSPDNWFSHCFGNSFEHPPEDPLMKRIEDVPVQEPGEPLGHVSRQLLKLCSAILHRVEPEFKGGFSREFHLSKEVEVIRLLHLENPEKIHSVTSIKPHRIPTPPPQTGAAHQPVDGTPQDPEGVCRVPAR